MSEKQYRMIKDGELQVVVFKEWEQSVQFMHCFTTRYGGVSEGDLARLNLGFNRGDLRENVIENYTRVAKHLHTSINKMVLSNQVHETNIEKVQIEHGGNGMITQNRWESCDGIYTKDKEVTLVTHYADCVPLFFYSSACGGIIGLAHAGWRGTVGEIGAKMVECWAHEEGIPVESIEVGIGPSIGPCCFEVHEDVAKTFIDTFGMADFIVSIADGKYQIDLWECNKRSLIKKGILVQNIYQANYCTCCHEQTFFSHRKTGGKRGTLGAFMKLI